MDITGKIEEVNQSDSLLLVVFYADWQVKAAVKELNPDVNSLGSRG